VKKKKRRYLSSRAILRTAAVAAIVAMGLMVWPMFHPDALVIMAALSIGQGLGTISLLAFIYVVIRDMRRSGVFEARTSVPPPSLPPVAPPSAPPSAPTPGDRDAEAHE
jgi:hypothetical protein